MKKVNLLVKAIKIAGSGMIIKNAGDRFPGGVKSPLAHR